jgi:hypothetical protein
MITPPGMVRGDNLWQGGFSFNLLMRKGSILVEGHSFSGFFQANPVML